MAGFVLSKSNFLFPSTGQFIADADVNTTINIADLPPGDLGFNKHSMRRVVRVSNEPTL